MGDEGRECPRESGSSGKISKSIIKMSRVGSWVGPYLAGECWLRRRPGVAVGAAWSPGRNAGAAENRFGLLQPVQGMHQGRKQVLSVITPGIRVALAESVGRGIAASAKPKQR